MNNHSTRADSQLVDALRLELREAERRRDWPTVIRMAERLRELEPATGAEQQTAPPTVSTYSIDYQYARDLRPLAECEHERAAIERLADFRGTADDVRIAAGMYKRSGEDANAEELLRMLPEAERSPR